MKNLLLHSNSLAQWQHLVHATSIQRHYNLSIELESYLVFLLMRFVNNTAFLNNILALDYLEALQTKVNLLNKEKLKAIGDECLLTSGLFPGKATKKRVDANYYINMGKQAYEILGHFEENPQDQLFTNLSHNFTLLMDLLLALRKEESVLNFSAPSSDFILMQHGLNSKLLH
ncbi:MAG: hypothetical protein ACKOAD_07350 [Gammaproteobacteria bacterium]